MLIYDASPQPDGAPPFVTVRICPPVTREDAGGLQEQLRLRLRGAAGAAVVCDVGAIADPDMVTVEVLARMQLCARRLGFSLQVRHASVGLTALLELTGLGDYVPLQAEP
ncbi:MAG TPA: STAS domain-containing protein [Streptosporangiaceae bacterium]|nr:STAS domain-containing protein [Streptosporangiaceae bacterium]